MNTKSLVSLALLVGMGVVLHAVVPPLFLGMKPDMGLTMMFLGIILFPYKKNVLLVGLTTGVIAALTTGFPGGQIPNVIDKLTTAFVFFGLTLILKKYAPTTIGASALTAIGTIVSGTIFLTSALFIVGLPGGATFLPLFTTIVLPTAVVNTIVMVIVYPVAQTVLRRMNVLQVQ